MGRWEIRIALVITLLLTAIPQEVSAAAPTTIDLVGILLVKGRLNSQKGDGDAATWLPPRKSYRCAYVSRQVAVKAKYGLWLTAPEKEAIVKILKTCL